MSDDVKSVIEPFETTDNDCIHIGSVLPEGSVAHLRTSSSRCTTKDSHYEVLGIEGYPRCECFINCIFTKAGASVCSSYHPVHRVS